MKDFDHRRSIALKGNASEGGTRLIGLLDWMESVTTLKKILQTLRMEGGRAILMEALVANEDIYKKRIPPNAITLEQIASVGLALLEEFKDLIPHLENRRLSEAAWGYGIVDGSAKKGDDIIGKYIRPFLDYVEQQLSLENADLLKGKGEKLIAPPAIIHDSLKRFHAVHRDAASTCFIMMRFGKTIVHSRLEKTIKNSLKKHGLVGVLARDREFHDDLYPNIQTYIHGCRFGIAVFERLETDEFNPNVALEVGYMFGLRKHVLLLKDQTLKALHTDLVGKLYREFDPQNPEDTIPLQIDGWLSDKGLA